MKQILISFIIFSMGAGISLMGCSQGDDLSEPLGPPAQVTEFSFKITQKAVLSGDTCYISEYWEDNVLVESEFYNVTGDTIYLKGSQIPSGPIVALDNVFSPVHPLLGSNWIGSGGNRIEVADSLTLTVPAGSFDCYVYTVTDTADGDLLGKMVFAEDEGLISIIQFDAAGDTSISIVLDSYDIDGGAGIYPLAVGNEWTLKRGVYEEE